MFEFLKAVRETAAARAVSLQMQQTKERAVPAGGVKVMTTTGARRIKPEQLRLRREIHKSQRAIDAARNHFEEAVDPTLIDCYIYELNAAQLRYQFLLRKFKSQEE
ncbi:MAG: YaaL family protein [Clostridium sp.]|nr:YaaL family protein [Clostridium sp.]